MPSCLDVDVPGNSQQKPQQQGRNGTTGKTKTQRQQGREVGLNKATTNNSVNARMLKNNKNKGSNRITTLKPLKSWNCFALPGGLGSSV